MDLSTITVADFKAFFRRDFLYLPTPAPVNPEDYVQDADIEKAFLEARVNFNQAFFSGDDNIRLGYYYLTANYLVNDLRAAMGGITAAAAFPLVSRSVGNVSESYMIPDAYKNNPSLAYLTGNPYGMKYLSLVLPQMIGGFSVAGGATLP